MKNHEPSSGCFPSKITSRAHNFLSLGFSHVYCNIIISSNNCVILWQNLILLLVLWFEMALFDSLDIHQMHPSQVFYWGLFEDRDA